MSDGGSFKTRLWAVVKYELLWNIRKKKFLGVIVVAFILATLSLTLPLVLSNIVGQPLKQNPDYAVNTGAGIGGVGMFLFAVVVVMNSISGEFESGTIVPLLTKPVSRTLVFAGKLLAAFITLLAAYTLLFLYISIGGTLVYGPQNNLHLIPLSLTGAMISTFVYASIVLAIGSISKSSLIAAIGTFGVFLALTISSPIISLFTDQSWILNYLPGSGRTGYITGTTPQTPYTPGKAISTGSDGIPENLVNYALYPSSKVAFYKIATTPGQTPQLFEVYEENLSLILARSIAVAIAYIIIFLLISWIAFKRSEVLE